MRAAYRVFFAVLTLSAVFVQFLRALGRPAFSAVNFFSFFTIESNILIALVFLAAVFLVPKDDDFDTFAMIRGAATLYMVATGIVYVLLLSGLEEALQTQISWVNLILHYVMPVMAVVDWVTDPPHGRLTIDRAVVWLAFPAVYLIYSLARGHIVGWYPYPFVNPEQVGGYGEVALYVMALTTGFIIIAFALIWAARRRATRLPEA